MHPTETTLRAPQGDFTLYRRPKRGGDVLRAWDSADEYLLSAAAEYLNNGAERSVLIANDSFGALTVALASWRPQTWSDSFVSQLATRDNLAANGLEPAGIHAVSSLEEPAGPVDVVLLKVPKTLALLEDQLIKMRSALHANSVVLVAGMMKALPRSVWPMLERLVGPTDTPLARKKAKLIRVSFDLTLATESSPYPVHYKLEGTGWLVTNHANVFSRDSLDIGTRFFLQHLPVNPQASDITDLGCGNGLLGMQMAAQHPNATIRFVDESFMAVASARENFRRVFGETRDAAFHVGDGLTGIEDATSDLVLCNPPFHQQRVVGNHIAQQMFRQAYKVLRPGGELWVIGNRHLGYHVFLKRLFGQVELAASNSKFVILRARRMGR